MEWRRTLATTALLLASGGVWAGTSVEIVVDTSNAMWEPLGREVSRFVAVRQVLFVLASVTRARRVDLDLALRTTGGDGAIRGQPCSPGSQLRLDAPLGDDGASGDPFGWKGPLGRRDLFGAVIAAASDLADIEGDRRIVVITSGGDECMGNVDELVSALGEGDSAISVRIIGLDLDPDTAAAFGNFAPTRNITQRTALVDALAWALALDAKTTSIVSRFRLNIGPPDILGKDTEVQLIDSITGEATTELADETGAVEFRLAPSRYRAELFAGDDTIAEFDGIAVPFAETIALALEIAPESAISLEIDPEDPMAGDTVWLRFSRSNDDDGWISVAPAGAAIGEHFTRVAVAGFSDEVELQLPPRPQHVELRFEYDRGAGITQLGLRHSLELRAPSASLTTPTDVEIGNPLEIEWTASAAAGDHIIVTPEKSPSTEFAACTFVGRDSPIVLQAPSRPGSYRVGYVTRFGIELASSPVEVYEILATLGAPDQVEPNHEFLVEWTGPGDIQDHLTIASETAPVAEYIDWSPTDGGSPARLRAPPTVGIYEVRYVRASDGAILARQQVTVVSKPITIEAPREVPAGVRFAVSWSGTGGDGDFIAVAPKGSPPQRKLDWAFITAGNPLTLAAPFNPGEYEIRYLDGEEHRVRTHVSLTVR